MPDAEDAACQHVRLRLVAESANDHQRITLRIPPGLHARLMAEAERNGRSLNAEVIARLEAGGTSRTGTADVLGQLERENTRLREALAAIIRECERDGGESMRERVEAVVATAEKALRDL